jgi:hypothetical protein
MEIPQAGRATIIDQFDQIEIISPAKRKTFIFGFLCVWLCGWLAGEIGVITTLINKLGSTDRSVPDQFLIVWLCGWTVGGCVALRVFIWMLLGKEVVTAGRGALTIVKKGALFIGPKTYDLREAKNFRIQEADDTRNIGWSNQGRRDGLTIANAGTIRFDYGMQTVKFAEGVDAIEAQYLLQKLRDKKILTDKNFELNQQPY